MTSESRPRPMTWVAIVVALAVIVAACGSKSESADAGQSTDGGVDPTTAPAEPPDPVAPTATAPVATATPEPEPTATPEPAPEPTSTPEPTATSEPDPEPTATTEPTATPEAEPTTDPTVAAAPTEPPASESTPVPVYTPDGDDRQEFVDALAPAAASLGWSQAQLECAADTLLNSGTDPNLMSNDQIYAAMSSCGLIAAALKSSIAVALGAARAQCIADQLSLAQFDTMFDDVAGMADDAAISYYNNLASQLGC